MWQAVVVAAIIVGMVFLLGDVAQRKCQAGSAFWCGAAVTFGYGKCGCCGGTSVRPKDQSRFPQMQTKKGVLI